MIEISKPSLEKGMQNPAEPVHMAAEPVRGYLKREAYSESHFLNSIALSTATMVSNLEGGFSFTMILERV